MEKNFEKLTGVIPLDKAEVNDCVQFGKFAWQVIGIEEGKKLLISKECMQLEFDYVVTQEDPSKEKETFEEWLADIRSEKKIDYVAEYNEIKKYFSEWFCEQYFSAEDLARIVPFGKTIDEKNEYIFLLSEEEVRKYIPKKEDRIATFLNIFIDVKRPWLLRVDGSVNYQMAVDTEGEIEKVPEGYICDHFRPAIWVK